MDRSSCPDLGFAERFGGFLYMVLYLVWHPASSSMGMKKKKPHEIWFTYYFSVKIEDNFTENLRSWCRYFMLSTVRQRQWICRVSRTSSRQTYRSCCSAAPSSDSSFPLLLQIQPLSYKNLKFRQAIFCPALLLQAKFVWFGLCCEIV